ncbi:MAG: glycosyltransferase family 4 protein [Candidatus Omnitrophica bacterium]|nr:glycosyltransferase family 4 protein [Candidatus Omnitrophota bacterium]
MRENSKIFVNSRFLTQRITGSQRFAIEISKQLKKLQPNRFVFVAPKNIVHFDIANELDVRTVGFNTGHLWEQIDLPMYLKKHNNPLLINLVNTAPIFYGNKIVTVHDISWYHFSDYVTPKFYYYYKILIPRVIKNSKKIFTVSFFSRDDIIKSLNLKDIKIDVVYNSVSDKFKFLNLEREKIILSVASLQPYKNISNLIKAFILLKTNNKFNNYKLTLVGSINKKIFSKTDIFEISKGRDDIIFAEYVSDDKLIEYYNKAEVFVLPSLFEGFGIPPLEAMACGCPCVVSNVASLPEVCGDAAYYVNPYDVKDIADGIEKVLTDENLRDDLIKKGFENVKRFSWESSARKIIEIIDSLDA